MAESVQATTGPVTADAPSRPRVSPIGGWLRALMTERFGLPLNFNYDEASAVWRMWLSGRTQRITIAHDPDTVLGTNSALPCTTWDAAADGWTPILDKSLPAPGASTLRSPLIERDADGYTIHYDIPGLTYWMLNRLEEIDATDLDEHGRFPARASHAYRHGYLERPIVDEWLDILRQVIERTWPDVPVRRPSFEMKVSHDVDSPSRDGFRNLSGLVRRVSGDLLKRRDPRGLAVPWIRLTTRTRLSRFDPHNTFDWLMDVSERHGLTSAFYFICGRGAPIQPTGYDARHRAIRTLIRHIHARGHEIGLHPSYGTYLDARQIRGEADRLRHLCADEGVHQHHWGGRMHFLQWRQPDTLRAWNDAGMSYDSTLSYADHAGFRCGTCFEYQAFDPVACEALELRVRPLVVMEVSAFGQQYMGLGVTENARDKMIELKHTCRRVGGFFTLLWHNSNLQGKVERRMYEEVVAA